MSQQQTISKTVELTGRGLFTGEEVTVRFRPAPPESGVSFIRADQPESVEIPATIDSVNKRARRSSLRNGTVSIETVEHFLAAVVGADVDNLQVELTGAGCELPVSIGPSDVIAEGYDAGRELVGVGPLVLERPLGQRVAQASARPWLN